MGEPYVVARVMDFVAPADEGEAGQQVRANIFLRMRDLTHRANNDSRLLVATMHAELYPVEAIRGKCRVKHRDLIGNGAPPELAVWKRKDDRFYYQQLYDRYIHRFYDVIPTWKVKNAPAAVLETLREKYSFIVAEPAISADLCDALRGCAVCHEWASSAESVRCDTCRKYFHMHCVSPPLQSKPAKGYSWSCAPCTKQHDALVEEQGVGGGGLHSDAAPPARAPRSQASASRRTSRAHLFGDVPAPASDAALHTAMDREGLRCFQGWPYRYFGEHTSAMDVLDAHDSIYPRAVTRCGPKYQMTVPSWEEQQELPLDEARRIESEPLQDVASPSPSKSSTRARRKSHPKKARRDAANAMEVDEESAPVATDTVYERGGDATVHCLYVPPVEPGVANGVETYLQAVRAPRAHVPRTDVSFVDRALELLCAHHFDTHAAAEQFAQSKDADFGYFQLAPKEIESLSKAMHEHGAEMGALKRALPARTPGEIVRSLYAWKTYVPTCSPSHQLGERWRAQSGAHPGGRRSTPTDAKPLRDVSPARSILSTDELDEIHEANPTAKLHCAFCNVATEPFWYRGFIHWTGRVLCVYCGQFWRKYAAETASVFITDAKRKAAQEHGGEERGLGVLVPVHVKWTPRTTAPHAATPQPGWASPAPPPVPEIGKCVLCRRVDPKRRLRSCAQCGMAAHQGCIGITDADMDAKEWLCDVCRNDRDPNVALLPHCVLCDEAAADRGHPMARGTRASDDDSKTGLLGALDVYKPTECNNWAHLVCAMWMPEVLFADAHTLQPVEGASSLPPWRYDSPCALCKQVRGAVVTCAEPSCRTRFHVACAFQAQPSCTLAFEIFPVKTSRRDSVQTLTFKSETGHMCAQIWCKEHRGVAKSNTTYDFFESDAKLGLTALQAYARTHKQVANTSHRNSAVVESSHALLRRAKRFDAVLQACGGAGAYLRDGSLHPMTHGESGVKMNQMLSTDSPTQPPTCIQCHTDWSPLWWPVAGADTLRCTRCHAAARAPDAPAAAPLTST